MTEEAIRFQAQVFKLQTLIDGGMRLTLDLITPSSETVISLINAKQPGILLDCAGVAVNQKPKNDTRKPKF